MEGLLAKVFSSFAASHILLIEWEHSLFRRLGYPLMVRDRIYLVPDDQLSKACDIATRNGLLPPKRQRPESFSSEYANVRFSFLISQHPEDHWESRRLMLLPLSWTGISLDELVPIPITENERPRYCTIMTVPLPALCAALVRMISRERRASFLRSHLISDLTNVIAHSLFDMSYEGDYMEFPPDDQPRTEKEVAEMSKALGEIRGWRLRKEDEWIREALVKNVSGQSRYQDLPCRDP